MNKIPIIDDIFDYLSDERLLRAFSYVDMDLAVYLYEDEESYLKRDLLLKVNRALLNKIDRTTSIGDINYLYKKGLIKLSYYKRLLQRSQLDDLITVLGYSRSDGWHKNFQSWNSDVHEMEIMALNTLMQKLEKVSLDDLDKLKKNHCEERYSDEEVCSLISQEIVRR